MVQSPYVTIAKDELGAGNAEFSSVVPVGFRECEDALNAMPSLRNLERLKKWMVVSARNGSSARRDRNRKGADNELQRPS